MKNNMFDWFKWNNAANESFIMAFQNSERIPHECIEIFSVIINEHERWLNRICAVNVQAEQNTCKATEEFRHRNTLMHDITTNFLRSVSYGENLEWRFTYVTDGKPNQRTLSEVYFHILTFSEFHRGQVAELLKENGIIPPLTDYMSLKNELN